MANFFSADLLWCGSRPPVHQMKKILLITPHPRGAKHPFLGRLNCADACLPRPVSPICPQCPTCPPQNKTSAAHPFRPWQNRLKTEDCRLKTKKKDALLFGSTSFFLKPSGSASAAGNATFLFAGLFKASPVAEFFERTFFVQFLFQTAQSAFDGFTFFQADFRTFHINSPPSDAVAKYS